MKVPFIRHHEDIPPTTVRYPDSSDVYGSARRLASAVGLGHIGVSHHTLRPGERSSRMHAHLCEDEIVFVLEGECAVRTEDGEYPVRCGDVVGFPAAAGNAHHFVNRGDHDAILLVVGEQRPGFERVYYPEDPEWMSRMPAGRTWSRADPCVAASPAGAVRAFHDAAGRGDIDGAVAHVGCPYMESRQVDDHIHVVIYDQPGLRARLAAREGVEAMAMDERDDQVEFLSTIFAQVRFTGTLRPAGADSRLTAAALYQLAWQDDGWRIRSAFIREVF